MATFLNASQIVNLIKVGPRDRTIFVSGENGIGKTAIERLLRGMPEFANHYFPGVVDCTQLDTGSVWVPDLDREAGLSRELPNERFGVGPHNHKGMNGARPVVIVLDEFGKCRQMIKDTMAPVVYEHRLGARHFPEGSLVVAFTNLSAEGLGDDFQAHMRSRVSMLYMRKPTQKEWVQNFAIPHHLDPVLIAATEQMPKMFDSFLDYEDGGKYKGKQLERDNPYIFNPKVQQDAFFSPRTAHIASDWLKKRHEINDDVAMQAILEGTVGVEAASHIMATVRFGNQLPSLERVLAEPDKAPLAASPVAQIVQVFQFVTQINTRKDVDAVMTYVQRMKTEMQGLLVNYVANSGGSRIAVWGTNARFGKMLTELQTFN